jgi:hypothetical protein
MTVGSASAFELSRPAQASLLLRPIGSLSGPRPPSSQGSDPVSYPAEPPASFRTNRQLSGCDPPSLVVRALGAHGHSRRSDPVTAISELHPTSGHSRTVAMSQSVPLPDSCIAAISRQRNASSSAQGRARALLQQWPTRRLGRRRHRFASKTALAQHCVVPQNEATKAQSITGLPMFGNRFLGSWLFAAALAQAQM